MTEFSHINEGNRASMVGVGKKEITQRSATAQAVVYLPAEIAERFSDGDMNTPKGPVLLTAILAGTMAAKKTPDLIPLCHNIPLDGVNIATELDEESGVVRIISTAKATCRTGVEMEALTAAAVAALTIYDMCKALSQDICIGEIRLLQKTGGKTDYFHSSIPRPSL